MKGLNLFEVAGVNKPEEEQQALTAPTRAPTAPTPVQATQPRSLFDVAGVAPPESSYGSYRTNEGVMNTPANMSIIRNYMVHRKGDYYKNLSDEETLDDFVDHMRWMETNEVSTFGEARQVFDLEEKDKPLYSEAYRIYDSIGNAYQAGGIGEVGDAALNYVGAVSSAPSTWIGGFVGRALSKGGSKAAGKVLQKALKQGVQEAVIDKGVKAGIKATAKTFEKKVTKKVGAISAKKSRKEMVAAALIGATTDGSMATYQNLMLQDTKIEAGYKTERDYQEAAFSAVFGLVGGGMAYLPDAMRGTVKLDETAKKIKLAGKLRAKEAKKVVGAKLEDSVKQLASDWETLAKQGQSLDAKKYIREKTIDWFFDVDNEKSFVRILMAAGAELEENNKGFSHQMIEFARGLPVQQRSAITRHLKPFGINFGEMIEIFAGALKEGGENLSAASKASRLFQDFKYTAVAKKKAIEDTLSAEDLLAQAQQDKPSPQVFKYLTSVWKRLLVSHPGTTMLNVKGWGVATGARTMSEILHGGVLGSVGLAQKMMGVEAADKTLAKSSAMFKSNGLLIRSLLDPYTAVQGFRDLLDHAPAKHRKDSLSTFFGGIGDERPEIFKLDPTAKGVRATEWAVDKAAAIALVKTQDIYTKAFSGLKELDKLSRIELGVGVEDLLAKGQTHLITDDMWEKAVKVLLEDTFSVNHTRGDGPFNAIAKTIESFSNTPGFGFIFPFGRFVNNTMSFSYQYSPLAFLPITKYQKGIDLQERMAKAVVGTSALMMVASREEEKQKEGLQWNEERTSTGDIKDVQGVFPLSLYNLVGRIVANVKNGGGVPLALKDELVKQVGPLGVLDDLTSSNPLTDLVRELSRVAEKDDGAEFTGTLSLIAEMLAGVGTNIAAGFTRPMDAVNDAAGMFLDIRGVVDDSVVDRKQSGGMERVIQNFSRYTNTFFNLLLGEDTGKGKLYGTPKNSAIEDRAMKDPNPISRTLGAPIKPRQDSIDILLGKVDMAPFKADSFTSGVPEYDDFLNNTVFPILERKAESLLESEFFNGRPLSIQRVMVNDMLKEARKEVIDALENGFLGNMDEVLFNERKKFVASTPQAYRAEAKRYLGITTEDRELSFEEMEMLQSWIDINKDLDEVAVDNM